MSTSTNEVYNRIVELLIDELRLGTVEVKEQRRMLDIIEDEMMKLDPPAPEPPPREPLSPDVMEALGFLGKTVPSGNVWWERDYVYCHLWYTQGPPTANELFQRLCDGGYARGKADAQEAMREALDL